MTKKEQFEVVKQVRELDFPCFIGQVVKSLYTKKLGVIKGQQKDY